jgi:hypothetical protein
MGSRMTGVALILGLGLGWVQEARADSLAPEAEANAAQDRATVKRDARVTPAQAPAAPTPTPNPTSRPPIRLPRPPAVPVPRPRPTTTPAPATTPTPAPATAPTPAPATAPATVVAPGMVAAGPSAATAFEAASSADRFGTLGSFSQGGLFQMIGDAGPNLTIKQAPTLPSPPGLPGHFPPGGFPTPPGARQASALAPSVRGFKIAENQSPRPQDRVFYSFNFYDDANAALNKRFDSPVSGLRVYREIWGFEKTFDNGMGSIGFRLPLNTLSANSNIRGVASNYGGTSTALGDLSIYTKYILKLDPATGSLISVGLLVTPPTGPNSFAGAKYLQSIHNTTISPFLGYIWSRGDFYLQGFSSLDVPSSVRDVTMVYNDIGLGYFVFRRNCPNHFLTAIAPTFETHVNTPLTHRDAYNINDPVGTADVVNLTYGINFEFYGRSVLTFGFVTPVTSPKPFAYEALLLFNLRFGGAPRRPTPVTPPVLGG